MLWRTSASAVAVCLLTVACDRGSPANATAQPAEKVEESVDSLRARAVRQDSELVAIRRQAQESALLVGQTRELSRIVAQIDNELAKVRVDAASARDSVTSCEGEGCARIQGERVRARVQALVARVRRAEARMRTAANQLAASTQEDSLLKQQIVDLQGTIGNLRGITERQQQELDRITGELTRARAENVALGTVNARLQQTLDSAATRDDSVYVIAASKATLIKLGVVEERGGSKWAFGRGKVLTPVASPPMSAFKPLSRARDTVLAMPNGSKWYSLVSAHSRTLLHGAATRDRRVKGPLTITSPTQFWSSGRFLILEER